MSSVRESLSSATSAVHGAAPGLVLLARLGYAAKGVVFIVIGVLAARLAAGNGGGTTDQRGALQFIGSGPLGTVALWTIGIGLLGYMAWRIVAAVTDAERKGNDATKLVMRATQAARGIAYGLLGTQAIRLAMRSTTGGAEGGEQARGWTKRLLDLPSGRLIVLAVAIGIIGYALYQLYRASSAEKVAKHLNLAGAGAEQARWIVRLGQFGIAARAVVFVLAGVFLLRASRSDDASAAGGFAESLASVASAPFGRVMLGVVATGLVAYGVYQLATARYRVMRAT